jgi:5-(aminomethyl)-3-furanmethanol phosphate kinase
MEAAALQRPAPKPSGHGGRIIVVKLGGSVVRARQLAAWLEVIAGAQLPLVIVTGGGALADEVRTFQRDLGFDDAAAHRMALLAMDQLAWAVASMRPGLEVGSTEDALRDILARGRVAVWAPYASIAGRTDVEESWRLTSDSLALWLAGKLGARACYIIKSIAAPRGSRTAMALASDGVLDAAFPDMLTETGVPAVMFGQGDQHVLAEKLADFTAPAGLSIE